MRPAIICSAVGQRVLVYNEDTMRLEIRTIKLYLTSSPEIRFGVKISINNLYNDDTQNDREVPLSATNTLKLSRRVSG